MRAPICASAGFDVEVGEATKVLPLDALTRSERKAHERLTDGRP